MPWNVDSATLSLWDKVTCRYSGFTFQTFVKQYESIILPPLLHRFSCSSMPVMLLSSRVSFLVTNLAALFCTFFLIHPEGLVYRGSRLSFHIQGLDPAIFKNSFYYKMHNIVYGCVPRF